MTVNTLILGFEVSIICLLFALCWQLSRQYRAFNQHKTSTAGYSSAETSSNAAKLSVNVSQMDTTIDKPLVEGVPGVDVFTEQSEQPNAATVNQRSDKSQHSSADAKALSLSSMSANKAWPEDQEAKSNAILNDYIDGFFSDSSAVSAELLANFKAEPQVASELSPSNEVLESAVDNVPVLQPILVDESSVDDEDSFIMVEESNTATAPGHESADVMSDKVVLAMLKEAKTACS